MSASNIYLRLITPVGPLIGEGLLHGWETAIELKSFEWGMAVDKRQEAKGISLNNLASMVGAGKTISVRMQPLTIVKRFDVSSSMIHTCLDNDVKIISATITVLHMKPNAIPPHSPGFVLNCANGRFESAELSLESGGISTELIERVTLNFEAMQMLYMKPVRGQPIPTAPFFHPTPIPV